MTVRELANDLLDLQLWQALLIYVLIVGFLNGIFKAAGEDIASLASRCRRRPRPPDS